MSETNVSIFSTRISNLVFPITLLDRPAENETALSYRSGDLDPWDMLGYDNLTMS